MTTLYDATIASFLQILPAVAGQLDKAEAHCRAHGLPDTALTQARLAPDMWPFAKQVQSVVNHSAGALAAAKAGEASPNFSEPPTSFADLKLSIEAAIATLRAVSDEELAALAGGDTTFRVGERAMPFTTADYLLSFAVPNFYFHAGAAYAILRKEGVEIGKRDFLGGLRLKG